MIDERRPQEPTPVLIIRTADGHFQDAASRDLPFDVLQEMVLDGTPFEIHDADTGADVTSEVVNEVMDSLT
jgi:hypothetical protein